MLKLGMRSALVMALLFGLLFAVGIGAMYSADMPMWFAIVFAVAVVGLQFLLAPTIIEWIYKISWVDAREVDPELASFIESSSAKCGIPVPRFGVIEDGNPNAFTFGHYPGNARVVVTRGLLDILSPRERDAVVAHELGHIKHYDFIVMTVAGLVPILLYIIYAWTRDRDNQAANAVALGAYLAYIVSQFIVLLLSRIREFFADDFSADVVGDPNALSMALVKISYGISRANKPVEEEGEKKKKGFFSKFKSKRGKKTAGFGNGTAMAAMGISSDKSGSGAVLSGISAGRKFDSGAMAAAMEWDIKNPWAFIYQLSSTHPLTAKRVLALNKKAESTGRAPLLAIPEEKAEGLGKAFVTDLIYYFMPITGAILSLLAAVLMGSLFSAGISLVPGIAVLTITAGFFIRFRYRYKSDFSVATVTGLLRELKVSKIRPVPIHMRGTIIGKGVPGLFWSEDLVLQDETGFIVLDYRQPFRLLDIIFGLRKAERFIGKEATVTGWYRRGMRPYVELYKIEAGDVKGKVLTYSLKTALIIIAFIAGVLMLANGVFALM